MNEKTKYETYTTDFMDSARLGAISVIILATVFGCLIGTVIGYLVH